jgi:hypothetical protein
LLLQIKPLPDQPDPLSYEIEVVGRLRGSFMQWAKVAWSLFLGGLPCWLWRAKNGQKILVKRVNLCEDDLDL